MKNLCERYLEVLLLDTTFQTVGFQVITISLLVTDKDKKGKTAALYILADKIESAVKQIVKAFKKHNK